MALEVRIEGGFAEVSAGRWLMGRGQPAAFFGKAVRRRRRGWRVRDRSALDLVETDSVAKCASSLRPFLTHIPCVAPVFAVSCKVLVAPALARKDAHQVRVIPMSARNALCATEFGTGSDSSEWVVMATAGRTTRVSLEDGQTMSARPEAVVAWTGKMPTGFCPKLSFWDILLPRGARDLLLTFYGPGVVWVEGVSCHSAPPLQNSTIFRRPYGV